MPDCPLSDFLGFPTPGGATMVGWRGLGAVRVPAPESRVGEVSVGRENQVEIINGRKYVLNLLLAWT